jgi:hypothetical protein
MSWAFSRSPRIALIATALVGLVWLNQGPSGARYDALAKAAQTQGSVALRAWLPFAFAYRRAADEELYFAVAGAIRGARFDRAFVIARRGETSARFAHLPETDGKWHAPYSEVPFEYPALILPFILLPALVAPTFDVFAVCSGALMAGLLLAAIALALRCRDSTDAERAARWWLGGALFLAQGGILIQRLDAVPTFFLALALWAAVLRRPFVFGLGVGLAASAKMTPAFVLFPMVAADRDAWSSRPALARGAAGLAAGLAVGFLPMLAISPGGLWTFLDYHRARGLHVESTYGVIASIVELAGGQARGTTLSFGSFNLDGAAATFWASASTVVLLVSVAALSAWIARLPAPTTPSERTDAIASAGLGGLLCVWLFGKVFSPQYMTWAIPFALAISARRVTATLVIAMAITQIYLRGFYDQIVEVRPVGVLALTARLAALVTLALYVVQALVQALRGDGPRERARTRIEGAS